MNDLCAYSKRESFSSNVMRVSHVHVSCCECIYYVYVVNIHESTSTVRYWLITGAVYLGKNGWDARIFSYFLSSFDKCSLCTVHCFVLVRVSRFKAGRPALVSGLAGCPTLVSHIKAGRPALVSCLAGCSTLVSHIKAGRPALVSCLAGCPTLVSHIKAGRPTLPIDHLLWYKPTDPI